MKRVLACLLLVLGVWASVSTTLAADEPVPFVRGYLFYSDPCPDCEQVRLEILPGLYRQYGQVLQVMAINVSDGELNEQWLEACQEAYDVTGSTAVPALFIADQAIIGLEEISTRLPPLVEELVSVGTDYPDVPRPTAPYEPTVRFMFFFSPGCSHCQMVEQSVLPMIKARFGAQAQWESYDVSQAKNYRALLTLGQLAGLADDRIGAVPFILLGDEYSLYSVLVGGTEIPAYLGSAIEWYLAVGGADLPGWSDELFADVATPAAETATPEETPTAAPTPTEAATRSAPPIHMAYFAELGCSECDRVSLALEHLQEQVPSLVVTEFDILNDVAINLCLADQVGMPEKQRHDAPAVFVGTDYMVDDEIQYDALLEMVRRYADQGAAATWEDCRTTEIVLPPPPPWWAVIVPGLVDGINPCAFATIIFFVSYLSIIRRRGQDIVMVGAAFTLAVFLSYLGFGMVLREVFAGLIDLVGPILRPILNILTAVVCLVLAVISLGDFGKARQGKAQEMTLQLPHRLRMWINRTIRESMRSETLVLASFVSGVVVSFVELACTGQVYVPIIQGLSNPAYRARSTVDLVVYCLAFVAPLIVVFVLSYMGTTSKQLTQFFNRYAAPVKLAMTVLFLGIGLWLVYDVLRIWGVVGPLLAWAGS